MGYYPVDMNNLFLLFLIDTIALAESTTRFDVTNSTSYFRHMVLKAKNVCDWSTS